MIGVRGGISAKELSDYLDSTCNTLAERRRKGVKLLLEIAEETQVSVMETLRKWESEDKAANIECRWLTNSISVDLQPDKIEQIARHNDAERIFQYPKPRIMERDDFYSPGSIELSKNCGVEENLKYIGADSAWKMGYAGKGRVICSFDDADGMHPALYDNWKGHDGDSAAAWFSTDPD
ncbi:MAG: hypothetical protein GWN00_21445, partial [Aliifodinibius sp.]|nr:hypothetical protein [Fodinibius sp.]NIY27276.1 hypothetical protein [Fodinibius sp.]